MFLKPTAVFLLVVCSSATLFGSDVNQQIAALRQANQDMVAQKFSQSCSDYAKIYADTGQFHSLDPRIIAGIKLPQPGATYEPKLAGLLRDKQYGHACSTAYVLVLEYLHEGNAQAAARAAATALEAQADLIGAAASGAASSPPSPAAGTPPPPSSAAGSPPPSTSATSTAPAAASAPPPASGGLAAHADPTAPGQSPAKGVSDWTQVDGHYMCYYYGYTGGSHYVGGYLWPNLGLMAAGIGITITPNDGYITNKGAAGKFSFSSTVPGKAGPESLGTMTFVSGSIAGHRALLQTDKQFVHDIIFPAKLKTTDGKPDAFSVQDTWCYQKH